MLARPIRKTYLFCVLQTSGPWIMSLNEGRGPPCRKESLTWAEGRLVLPSALRCLPSKDWLVFIHRWLLLAMLKPVEALPVTLLGLETKSRQHDWCWFAVDTEQEECIIFHVIFLEKDIWPWVSSLIEVYLLVLASFLERKRARCLLQFHKSTLKWRKWVSPKSKPRSLHYLMLSLDYLSKHNWLV